MRPPERRRRPAWQPGGEDLVGDAVNSDPTRRVTVAPDAARMLAIVVPCALCDAGLCWRCWIVARVAHDLAVAGRRDQAADDLRRAA